MNNNSLQVEKENLQKIIWFVKHYPVPVLAVIGLVAGGVLQITHEEQAGKIVWFVTLVAGGIPVVWQTVR